MITGVSGLYHLKGTDPGQALDKVCREFESLFLHQLMKVMGETVPDDGLFEKSLATDIYRDMLFESVGKAVAQTDALGMAKTIKNHERALQAYRKDSGTAAAGR